MLYFSSTTVASTRYELAFDEFNNPAQQTYKDTPINLIVRMVDRSNDNVFVSEFPSIYVSNSFDIDTPTVVSNTLAHNDAERGDSQTQDLRFTWPYTTTTAISEKISISIQGGITCCQDFDSIGIRDS